MGFFNEIKKVLFGAQSLGKSAANKAVETAKEAGQEIKERSGEMASKAEDFLNSALDKVEDLGAIVIDKAQDVMGTKKETEIPATPPVAETPVAPADAINSLFEETQKQQTTATPPPVSANPVTEDHSLNFDALDSTDTGAPREKSTAEKIGAKVLDTTIEAGKKVEEVAAKAGEKLLDVGSSVFETMKEVAGSVGEKVIEKGGEVWEKVKEMQGEVITKTDEIYEKAKKEASSEKHQNQMEDLIQKAKEMGDKIEEKAKDKDRTFMDVMDDAKKNDLSKHDDFFDKAKRWADGDNGAFSNEPRISKDPNFQSEKGNKTHGFEDGDKDGDDLIDDAIIDDTKPE
ncbi:hypothetical protein [Haliscomenobacter hydrossis]|uniref:Uncharacterized protein n=1 Tax=Haliscomenobacter hydrossis (strain ATCC 27775 / DSM 1100 / LMG 10767 / O) TaxID=760192 RepID=F4L1R7_HALH1|nr:hypothetical protein [Haliscomenobacter hydrossis]AEE49576.1 hypothetical protein Halhy_1687 [Haliscomenobacter hydrossis DSM 1100]